MNKKRGVTILVLVITIIVLAILAGASIKGVSNVLDKANKQNFVTELKTLQDKTKEYYITFGELPVDKTKSYTVQQLFDLYTDEIELKSIKNEVNKNSDNEAVFYKLDLNELEVETEKRGKSATSKDIFVVSSYNYNVYYLQGEVIEDKVHFSLVNLIEKNKVY